MTSPINEEFLQTRFDYLSERLLDYRTDIKEDFESVSHRLDLIDGRLASLQSRMKFETIGIGGLAAFFTTMMAEMFKSN